MMSGCFGFDISIPGAFPTVLEAVPRRRYDDDTLTTTDDENTITCHDDTVTSHDARNKDFMMRIEEERDTMDELEGLYEDEQKRVPSEDSEIYGTWNINLDDYEMVFSRNTHEEGHEMMFKLIGKPSTIFEYDENSILDPMPSRGEDPYGSKTHEEPAGLRLNVPYQGRPIKKSSGETKSRIILEEDNQFTKLYKVGKQEPSKGGCEGNNVVLKVKIIHSDSVDDDADDDDDDDDDNDVVEGNSIPEVKTIVTSELVEDLNLGKWAKCAMETFGLNPLPHNWTNPTLLEQCHVMDDQLWRRYYDARRVLEQTCEQDSKKHPSEATDHYLREVKRAFHNKWKSTVLGAVTSRHTYQRATRVTKNRDGSLGNATVVSTVFSPYLFPRALQLCLQYHRSEQSFNCTFRVQFVNLNVFKRKDELMNYWRPSPNDMWELCSNSYLDMPSEQVGWMDIENIDTEYFTPNMVRKIRKWLFGHYQSCHLFHDMDLLSYLLGSCGAVQDFNVFQGDIGYTWKAKSDQAKDMQTYGTVVDKEVKAAMKQGTTWLEFQCRLASGSLRQIDQWYEQYDQKLYKGLWGAQVLDYLQQQGRYEKDDEIRNNPWMIWDKCERGVYKVEDNDNSEEYPNYDWED